MNAPEFDKKINISLGLIIGLVVASFTLGGVVSKVLSQEAEIQSVRDYVGQEVGGLRSDWERNNKKVEKEIDYLKGKHE